MIEKVFIFILGPDIAFWLLFFIIVCAIAALVFWIRDEIAERKTNDTDIDS